MKRQSNISYALPEYYIRVTSPDRISQDTISKIRKILEVESDRVFREFLSSISEKGDPRSSFVFPDEIPLEVIVEFGSIKGRVKTTLTTMILIIATYGGFTGGIEKMCEHMNWVLNEIHTSTKRQVIAQQPLDLVWYQRRVGSITRLVEMISQYYYKNITKLEFRLRTKKHIERILMLKGADELFEVLKSNLPYTQRGIDVWKDVEHIIMQVKYNKLGLEYRMTPSALMPNRNQLIHHQNKRKGKLN